jgi:hypothetical protein
LLDTRLGLLPHLQISGVFDPSADKHKQHITCSILETDSLSHEYIYIYAVLELKIASCGPGFFLILYIYIYIYIYIYNNFVISKFWRFFFPKNRNFI